jgi:hypothetical protein
MRNPLIVGEMLRMLGAAAGESWETVEQPEQAAVLLRSLTLSATARSEPEADHPEARRRILQPIELEDGSVVYRLRRGHCGIDECCGPEPPLAETMPA